VAAAESEHLDRVRDRFTRTAEAFAQFALTVRSDEAERLAALSAPRSDARVLDLACGPGTFTRPVALRARFVVGVDLTPAMLDQARQASARAGLANVAFACADANALPFGDSAVDLALCAYSLHHFLHPARTVRELCRVVRRGGKVAVVDLIVPQGADAEAHTGIERARDSSHANSLGRSELFSLLDVAGLRVVAEEVGERVRRFDDWLRVVGSPPGSPAYAAARRLMEASLTGDTAGFHPRFVPAAAGAAPAQMELEFVQTSLFVVAEKR